MPFDKLVNRVTHIPELYSYHALPPRPVINYAQYIVPAVDKIAQSLVYLSPYERQMRGAELAKAQVGQMQASQQMQLAPQMMDLQRREIAAKEKQLGFQEKFYNHIGDGGSLPQGWIMGANGPVYDPSKYKASLGIKQQTDEANSAANYGSVAEQFRKANGAQPQPPTDDDEDFWLKYHAAVAKHGEGKFSYDDDGNPIPNE